MAKAQTFSPEWRRVVRDSIFLAFGSFIASWPFQGLATQKVALRFLYEGRPLSEATGAALTSTYALADFGNGAMAAIPVLALFAYGIYRSARPLREIAIVFALSLALLLFSWRYLETDFYTPPIVGAVLVLLILALGRWLLPRRP
jgi:hypothetical protein